MKERLISACYITKNGGDFLNESMLSIKDYVYEIIVADNMSTDNTIEIAKKHNARIIQKDYTKLFEHLNVRKSMAHNAVYLQQRNDALKLAKSRWILVMDDDEVYLPKHMEFLVNHAKLNRSGKELRWNFLHFWKTPAQIIKGDVWRQTPQRFYPNSNTLEYTDKENDVFCHKRNNYLSKGGKVYIPNIKCFHYSYLKPEQHIRNKIKYYMLKECEHINEENVEKYLDKHPYFSNNFNIKRYGEKGFKCIGTVGKLQDHLANFPIDEHPKFMIDKFKEMRLI